MATRNKKAPVPAKDFDTRVFGIHLTCRSPEEFDISSEPEFDYLVVGVTRLKELIDDISDCGDSLVVCEIKKLPIKVRRVVEGLEDL